VELLGQRYVHLKFWYKLLHGIFKRLFEFVFQIEVNEYAFFYLLFTDIKQLWATCFLLLICFCLFCKGEIFLYTHFWKSYIGKQKSSRNYLVLSCSPWHLVEHMDLVSNNHSGNTEICFLDLEFHFNYLWNEFFASNKIVLPYVL
jgi:hypothetical protein